ncbi:MAG: MFS transporter [Candidatus Bathyarchaeota archaeon]|nr:MFS transporter [Candidatus Bathyarchaeota archaeon]MDH5494673.1 MFS transporter [Candidatus Bathyarchaeota archaeon]
MVKGDFKLRLLFLCGSHTLLHVYTNLPLALLPILISEYRLSIVIASIIVSLPRAFSLIFSVPSGLLADRLSHTKLISFSLFLEVLAASLIMLFPTVEIIVLCFSLTALASTFYHPPALSATSSISSSDFLSRGLGFHGASGTFGISLGPITLGLILSWFDWRYVYLIWVVPISVFAVTAFFVNVNKPSLVEHDERKGKGLTTPLKDVLSVTFLSFLLLMLFRSAADGTISTYLTTYLTGSKGLDASLASIIFGLSPLIGLTSVIIGGYAGDKLGWRRSLTLIVSTVTIALFCMFVSTSTIQTVVFYLAYGFFNIMTMPITTSLVAKIIPPKSRGTAYSLQFIPMSIIGIVMPIILGVLINFLEIWIIFPMAIVFYIIALVITQVLKM